MRAPRESALTRCVRRPNIRIPDVKVDIAILKPWSELYIVVWYK